MKKALVVYLGVLIALFPIAMIVASVGEAVLGKLYHRRTINPIIGCGTLLLANVITDKLIKTTAQEEDDTSGSSDQE